jgi:hypothetical protein
MFRREDILPRARFPWLYAALIAAAATTAQLAPAQLATNNVLAGARALSFLQPALSGSVTAAIVYQPGDAASVAEAQAIEHTLGSGLVIGSLTLKPKRVSANALDGLAGAKVAFVTRAAIGQQVASATGQRSIVTISSDPGCAQAGLCVVSISSGSKVQITVSKAACRAAKIKFNAAFLMLVKEI